MKDIQIVDAEQAKTLNQYSYVKFADRGERGRR
jgi:hypothetical protein